MSYRFRLRGNGLRHSWEKECPAHVAIAHAVQVARECGMDSLYLGARIRVMDDAGNDVALVPVGSEAE